MVCFMCSMNSILLSPCLLEDKEYLVLFPLLSCINKLNDDKEELGIPIWGFQSSEVYAIL